MASGTNQFGPNGWTPDRLGSLAGKTYVITGANAGAGYEATRVFLSKGAKVVMLNRNTQKSTAAIETLKQECGADDSRIKQHRRQCPEGCRPGRCHKGRG